MRVGTRNPLVMPLTAACMETDVVASLAVRQLLLQWRVSQLLLCLPSSLRLACCVRLSFLVGTLYFSLRGNLMRDGALELPSARNASSSMTWRRHPR